MKPIFIAIIVCLLCVSSAASQIQSPTTSHSNMMFGITLRPEAVKIKDEVERFFGTSILEKQINDPKSRYYAASGFAATGAPQITLYNGVADEASIVHELFHLKLIVRGFPFVNYTIPSEFINIPTTRFLQTVQSHIDDAVQHFIFFTEMRRMGYDPDVDTRAELLKAMTAGNYGALESEQDKSIFFWMVTLNYFKANLEITDSDLLERLTTWYTSRGWIDNVKIAGYFIHLVKTSKLTTPKEYVLLLEKTLELVHPTDAKFKLQGWKSEKRGSGVLRSVTFEMERVFKQ